MLDIEIQAPLRTSTAYEFRGTARARRSWREGLRPRLGAAGSSELHFGYRASNFEIRHHEVWDGFYALFYLIRYGGPLFGQGHREARIRLDFPVAVPVRDFFVQRALGFGYGITVEAPSASLIMEATAQGQVLMFGGGKESRLLLGLIREAGVEPEVVTAMPLRATDLPSALISESVHGALVDRLMPGLMRLGTDVFYGGSLGGAHRVTPWQQAYDLGSAENLAGLSKLLRTMGAGSQVHAPLAVLPANLIQRLLHDRHAELFAGQMSTREGARNFKGLSVALLKMLHDLHWRDRFDEAALPRLVERWVQQQTDAPDDHGYRDNNLTFDLEMRAVVWRLRDRDELRVVRDRIPDHWAAAWIDYVHDYVDTTGRSDPGFMRVFRESAPLVSQADPGLQLRRVEV